MTYRCLYGACISMLLVVAGCDSSFDELQEGEPSVAMSESEVKNTNWDNVHCLLARAALHKKYPNIPVRIGIEGDFAPFNYVDQFGVLSGFDKEFSVAACALLGVQCVFKQFPWGAQDGSVPPGQTSLFNELINTKSIDLIVSGVTAKPERLNYFDFSDPYLGDASKFAVLPSNTTFDPSTSLAGKIITTAENSGWSQVIQDTYPGAVFVSSVAACPSPGSLSGPCTVILPAGQHPGNSVQLVLDGDAEAILTSVTGLFQEISAGSLKVVGDSLIEGETKIMAVRKRSVDPIEGLLRRNMNCAIDRLLNNGTFDTINGGMGGALSRP